MLLTTGIANICWVPVLGLLKLYGRLYPYTNPIILKGELVYDYQILNKGRAKI